MARDMQFPMETIRQILAAHGIDSIDDLEVNDPVTVSPPAFEDLTIERIGDDLVAVGHYYIQRGDQMCDPEITFKETDDEWRPVEYIHHPLGKQRFDESGLMEVRQFISSWDSRLEKQGFVRAAEQDANSGEEQS